MRSSLLGIVLAAFSPFVASGQEMPANAKGYMAKNYPGWEIIDNFRINAPAQKAIAKGDFNGDGKQDVAVVIKKDNRIYAIALLADKKTYKAINLLAQTEEDRWVVAIDVVNKSGEAYLRNEKDGTSVPFRLKSDAISLIDAEGHGQINFWENGKFRQASDY